MYNNTAMKKQSSEIQRKTKLKQDIKRLKLFLQHLNKKGEKHEHNGKKPSN